MKLFVAGLLLILSMIFVGVYIREGLAWAVWVVKYLVIATPLFLGSLYAVGWIITAAPDMFSRKDSNGHQTER